MRAWFAEAKKAEWKGPADILCQFTSARIIGKKRVVFKIKGNDYR